MEALIRDDFDTCIGLLRRGIDLNKENAPLNRDMSMVIDNVRAATIQKQDQPLEAPPSTENRSSDGVRTDFSLYSDPNDTKH